MALIPYAHDVIGAWIAKHRLNISGEVYTDLLQMFEENEKVTVNKILAILPKTHHMEGLNTLDQLKQNVDNTRIEDITERIKNI